MDQFLKMNLSRKTWISSCSWCAVFLQLVDLFLQPMWICSRSWICPAKGASVPVAGALFL
jgi:hypothetical protein